MRNVGARDYGRILIARELLEQRPAGVRRENSVARLDDATKDRLARHELPPHAPPLRPHAGKDERELALVRAGATRDDVRSLFAGEVRIESVEQLGVGRRHDADAIVVMRATQRRRVTDVGERRRVLAADVIEIGTRERAERLFASRGEREDNCRSLAPLGMTGTVAVRSRLQHDVRICAAEAERVHAGQRRRAVRVRPRLQLRHHAQPVLLEVDDRTRRVEVQRRRDLSMFQGERGFDQSRDSRSRLEMSDVGFDGADEQWLVSSAAVGEHGAERLRLLWIADGGAWSVRFDVLHVAGVDARTRQRVAQHLRLRLRARNRHAVRASVLIDRRTANDGVHRIAVFHCFRERLEHDDADAFAADVAVAACVECLAASVHRQHARLAKADRQLRREQCLHAGDDGDGTIAIAERGDGAVERGERRGARGVDGEARAAEVVHVRNPIRRDARRRARIRVRVDEMPVLRMHLDVAIVVRRNADVDADVRAGEAIRRKTGVFERRPCRLEEHAMLHVDARRFARRHAKELRVELVDVADESTPAHVDAAGLRLIGVVEAIEVEAIRGHLGDRVDAVAQQLPESLRPVAAAWESAPNADDGDLVMWRGGRARIPVVGHVSTPSRWGSTRDVGQHAARFANAP